MSFLVEVAIAVVVWKYFGAEHDGLIIHHKSNSRSYVVNYGVRSTTKDLGVPASSAKGYQSPPMFPPSIRVENDKGGLEIEKPHM